MPRQKLHPKMPVWIWRLPPYILSHNQKHLLAYLWWCGEHGCHSWNFRLAKMFKCSTRTIRRRLQQLKALHLVHYGHPQDKGRTIWSNPYYNINVWVSKVDPKAIEGRWTKLSTINNAQQKDSYKTNYPSAGLSKELPLEGGKGVPIRSGAARLSCSAEHPIKLGEVIATQYPHLTYPTPPTNPDPL
jgi:hypothetical protein